MTTEAMLKAIIEAQVKGGYTNGWSVFLEYKFKIELDWVILEDGEHASVLEILLDPAGLRAAYGRGVKMVDGSSFIVQPEREAHEILDGWLSKPEGDAHGAIRTAFELLPSVLIERI